MWRGLWDEFGVAAFNVKAIHLQKALFQGERLALIIV
jgi:hypothetical protein